MRVRSPKSEKICPVCNKPFTPIKSMRQITCSAGCQLERVRQQSAKKNLEISQFAATLVRICKCCGKQFLKGKSYKGGGTAGTKYCSDNCKARGFQLACQRQRLKRAEEKKATLQSQEMSLEGIEVHV